MTDLSLYLYDFARVVEILDEPLVALERLARGLFRAHRVGLLSWHGRFAARGSAAVEGIRSCWRYGGLGA